ncbi:unnamed protein product [Ilex paraguariensis]|uniref:Uncharacterized protein n=1 Tax=Ilex paraguariensis TaxID=185542 RepID=A0ABC8TV59_9AQUA
MDNSRRPLSKRTRLQDEIYFRRCWAEIQAKKKAEKGAVGGESSRSGSGGGGRRGVGARIENGAYDSESVAVSGVGEDERGERGSEVAIMGDNVDDNRKERVGYVNFGSSEGKKIGKSEMGSKMTEKDVEINGNSEKIQIKLKKGVKEKKKKKNLGPIGGGLKRNMKLEKSSKNVENLGRIGVDDDVSGIDSDSDSEVQCLGEGIASNGSSLKSVSESWSGSCLKPGSESGSGSKVWFEKGENFDFMDESSGVKTNEGKNNSVVDEAQPEFGDSKKGKDVRDANVFVVSEDSEKSIDLEDSEDYGDSEETEESESSSEEDNDDPDDEDYRMEKWFSPDDCSSSSEDADGEDENNECDVVKRKDDGKRKEKMVDVGLKRKRKKEEEEEEKEDDENNDDVVEINNVNGMWKEKKVEAGWMKKIRACGVTDSYSCSLNDERQNGNGCGILKAEIADGEEKKRSTLGGLDRRKFCGLDILVNCDKGDNEEHKTLVERLRSNSVPKSRKTKQEFGKFSCPLPVEEYEEPDPSSDSEGDNDDNYKDNAGKIDEKGKEKVVSSSERKDSHAPKDLDFLQILADSIWETGDTLRAKLESHGQKATGQEPLPLKFRFEDEDPAPLEKPEWQKDMDDLFVEMEMALRTLEIGSAHSSVVDNDDIMSTETETNPAALCRRGDHYPILDEEIGIRCRYCSLVLLEMKYVLPTFSKHSWERQGKKDFGKSDCYILDDFPLQDSACQDQYGSKSSDHTEGTVWDIIPGIKESMYPHQREGFEFLWRNIAGEIRIEKLKQCLHIDGSPIDGRGCIISHAPGTGKTRLTIVFLQTLMKRYPKCQPLIIAPLSMLRTWEYEFQKWNVDIPFHNLNKLEFSGQENATAMEIHRQAGNSGRRQDSIRLGKLYSWTHDTSILGISYGLFKQLVGGGKNKGIDEKIREILLKIPGVLVLDEGHTPRNDRSCIWKDLSKVETWRRIILSGTPFQNNFSELYNTLRLVNPNFDDWITSRSCGGSGKNLGWKRSNIARGKWASLTSSIGKNTDEKLKELKAMIEPFVHVYQGTILQENLPGLKDTLIILRPTDLQKSLLEKIQRRKSYFKVEHCVSLITIHPSLLPKSLLEEEEFGAQRAQLEKLKLDPYAGVKTEFVIELVRLGKALDEKVLVFSQFLDPLAFIMERLKAHFDWSEGREVLYMHGSLDEKQRHSLISVFNDPTSEVRVLLASTKACSEGINLVGASRVVLLDVVWNPSVQRQAISRAYRLGQKKLVYIYHLIAGTMEGEKFVRLVEKDRLSELVFTSMGRNNDEPEILPTVPEDKILETMVQHRTLSHIFEKILYKPKESDLFETFNLVDL